MKIAISIIPDQNSHLRKQVEWEVTEEMFNRPTGIIK